jgi:hypothetical protein
MVWLKMSLILSVIISGIYLFLLNYHYGQIHNFALYRINAHFIGNYIFGLIICSGWKVYCSEWSRLTKKPLVLFIFERILYPVLTIILITTIGKKELILDNPSHFLQILLFCSLVDIDNSIRNKARLFVDAIINRNNPNGVNINEKNDIFLMHILINGFFILVLLKTFFNYSKLI